MTERDRIEAFLEVTGFDAALDSIAFSAAQAPNMLGLDPELFGQAWVRLSDEVFAVADMRGLALEILEHTLSEDLLNHAVSFYTTDLGQRLVAVENASHLKEEGLSDEERLNNGRKIVSDLVEQGAPRLQLLKRMNLAIDASGTSLKALQEVQFRFLIAASSAGVIELKMDPDELRALLSRNETAMRLAFQESALAGAAYTYRGFDDMDIEAYAEALEDPQMQLVYELLNAVQYEIMANRFELLAHKMAGFKPGQDI